MSELPKNIHPYFSLDECKECNLCSPQLTNYCSGDHTDYIFECEHSESCTWMKEKMGRKELRNESIPSA